VGGGGGLLERTGRIWISTGKMSVCLISQNMWDLISEHGGKIWIQPEKNEKKTQPLNNFTSLILLCSV
jgi:hypothetical protein